MTDPYSVPIEDLQQELEAMQKGNEDFALKLGQEGVGVHPYVMLSLRLDTLLESILDDRNRILFEIRYEQAFYKMLETLQSTSNRSKLLQGMRGPRSASNDIIVP